MRTITPGAWDRAVGALTRRGVRRTVAERYAYEVLASLGHTIPHGCRVDNVELRMEADPRPLHRCLACGVGHESKRGAADCCGDA